MKKIVYVLLLISLALVITLVGVYFVNKSNMNQSISESTSKNPIEPEKSESTNPKTYEVIEDLINKSDIIQDSSTPKNYNDNELIELEKEINSLDISDQSDIQ